MTTRAKFADVIFPYPPYQVFTYGIPERFGEIEIGHRVIVPLGKRKMSGLVIRFVSEFEHHGLKYIEDILDPYPLLSPDLLELTGWIGRYYLTSHGRAIRAALPPGLVQKSRLVIRISGDASSSASLSQDEKEMLEWVRKKKSVTLSSLGRQWQKEGFRHTLHRLQKLGQVTCTTELSRPGAKARFQKIVDIKDGVEISMIERLGRKARAQAKILSQLVEEGPLPREQLKTSASTLQKLALGGWITIDEEEIFREAPETSLSPFEEPSVLTPEQDETLVRIQARLKQGGFCVFLVHGVTSSGKTQVYIESIRSVLGMGRTALVLIPEISLTPQAVHRYRSAFGDRIAVLHSRMSPGERYDAWRRIRENSASIAIGPRSALFAPLANLGLIIVDEEHEQSYKQEEPEPRYHARDAAVVRGRINDCTVILGSATPSLESYFNAMKGKYTLCTLKERVDKAPMPKVILSGHKEESPDIPGKGRDTPTKGPYAAGKVPDAAERIPGAESRIFSPLLLGKMRDRLDRNEQIILLQNRRGYSNFLRCASCGFIEKCGRCDISLTYHSQRHALRCHYCGFHKSAGSACSRCGGASLRYQGTGTQKVEEEIRRIFPDRALFRMDLDTTRGKHSYQHIIAEFEKGNGDILIGTQMVAKGHDFPGVTLVGIISADTGIHFPDFRAGERMFQLLTQAAGRAGRRDRQGEVIIQTLLPDHPVLRFAVAQDYRAFYEWETEERRELGYPPWGRMAAVRFLGPDEAAVLKTASAFCSILPASEDYTVLGPVPSPLARIKSLYRYQLLIRGHEKDSSGRTLRNALRKAIATYGQNMQSEVRMHVDIDPVDLM